VIALTTLNLQNKKFCAILPFSAVAYTSRVNCDEMAGDRPRQPARASREH